MSHFGHELLGEATDVSHQGVWLQCDSAPGVGESVNAAGFAPRSGKALFLLLWSVGMKGVPVR